MKALNTVEQNGHQPHTRSKGIIMRIEGSVAVVTGANRGLGQHFAEQLLARGAAKVYAAARNPGTVAVDGVVPLRVDITDPDSISAASEIASDATLLINNAGIYTAGGVLETPLETIRQEMETNFYGTLLVTRAFAPHLITNAPGAILNVASVLSWLHPIAFGTYSCSKAALWAQTDVVREELKAHGVSVTALHVGFMETDMTTGIDAAKSDPGAVAADALDGVEAGLVEVLADDLTRSAKAQLSADRGTVSTRS
jgi:NAD(P)-dependent dehydrogenase (short-subunit alcohol dehydrogenase family)